MSEIDDNVVPEGLEQEFYDLSLRGDVAGLILLLAHHPDLSVSEAYAATAGACEGRQMDVLRLLEDEGLHGPPTLWTAVYSDWPELAVLLLDRGADTETVDSSGDTPLLVAALLGKVAALDVLAGRGANVRARNEDGLSALHLAAQGSRAEAVRFLLSLGLDPNHGINKRREACLHIVDNWCVSETSAIECRETIRLLLRAGADIDAPNADGNTPVLLATQRQRTTSLDELIRWGADFQKPGVLRRTPLMIATISMKVEAANLLIRAGANVNAEDEFRSTALNMATHCAPIVELLIRAGASTDHVDSTGKTPLQTAQLNGELESVRILTANSGIVHHSG